MILRIAFLLCLCSVCTNAISVVSLDDPPMEDVLLHDGRHIKVARTEYKVNEFKIRDPFFGLPVMPRNERIGTEFRLMFVHPDTGATITWQGKPNYTPVLLDIVDGVPYLVLNGPISKETESNYGCPELPYFYLKYESGIFGKWVPVPVDKAPGVLRESNLSQARRNDGGYFQKTIPRTYSEWNYQYKNQHLNERKVWDCRPPRILPPEVVLPAATEGLPEILETINYTPDRVVKGDDWTNLVFDLRREGECKNFFRPTDPNDYMQGQRFVSDSTGDKPAPYSRTTQFKMGVRVLCDDHIWFVTHLEEPGKIVISKFTITGDLVYRTSFRKPDRVDGFIGFIRIPSLRSKGGYLYFDWLDFREIDRDWHIKRQLEMRMREPEHIGNFQR
jgi:hypothetical protein